MVCMRRENEPLLRWNIFTLANNTYTQFGFMLHSYYFQRSVSTFKNTVALKRAALDIKSIISRQDEMRQSIKRRGGSEELDLSYVIENRQKEINLQNERNRLVNERKKLGAQLGQLMKNAEKSDDVSRLQNRLLEFKKQIGSIESDLETVSENVHRSLEALPNWLDPTVPEDPLVPEIVDIIGADNESTISLEMPPTTYDHKTIGENLNIMNFSTASRISGSSWYYLVGDGALLEQALVQYALQQARARGYRMVIPPSIVKSEVVHACGFKPRDQNGEKQVYAIENEPLSLTGTAEIPMGALHSSSTIEVPTRYVGVSRAYRAEAGARGKDTTGLYRVHEFTKVELFHFTHPDLSAKELEEIKDFQISILSGLGIKAKVLNMPTTDLGAPAMKKYDCEAWMPGRAKYGELTSCSNCGDYQSRRLGIRFKNKSGKLDYVHTLNGTAMAVPRVIVAILEQNYDPTTQSVRIPEALRPFMDGKEFITAN